MLALPMTTADPAALTMENIEVSTTIKQTADDTDDYQNIAVRDVRRDAPPVIGLNDETSSRVDAVGSDEVEEATSDDEQETSSSSLSDASEHPDLPEENEAPGVPAVQPEHANARTKTTSPNGSELSHSIESPAISAESVEKPSDDGVDMSLSLDQLLCDMLQAGLQPRGGNSKHVVTPKAKTNPIRAAKEKEKLDKKAGAAMPKDDASKKVSRSSKA